MILSTGATLNHAPFHAKLNALVDVHFQPSTHEYIVIIVHKMWRKVIVTTVFFTGAVAPIAPVLPPPMLYTCMSCNSLEDIYGKAQRGWSGSNISMNICVAFPPERPQIYGKGSYYI